VPEAVMKKKVSLFVLISIFLVSFVSAQISLSEPMDVYNLGDRLYVSADGLRGSDSGNLNFDLICENLTTNLLKISARAFSSEEDQSYSIPYKILTKEDLEIGDLNSIIGSCQVSASLGNEISTTKVFTITDSISIEANVDKINYDPTEGITLDILSTRANGDLVNGFVEVTGATEFSKAVIDGVAIETFSMPETSEAGDYNLDIRVYDLDSDGERLNNGEFTISFKINQIASLIETSLSSLEVIPGENFSIGEEIFDQSGASMPGNVRVELTSPSGEEIVLIVESGEFKTVDFPFNSSEGNWVFRSSFDNLVNEHDIEVLGVQKINVEVEESILTVRNVGNTRYNKTIYVRIGEEKQELELNMEINEERKFGLKAPDGEYEVIISNGEDLFEGKILLTGNAISIKDLETVGIFKNYSVIWIFLIVVLGATGFVFFMRFKKTKKLKTEHITGGVEKLKQVPSKIHSKLPDKIKTGISNSLNFTHKSPKVQGLDHENYSHEDKTMLDLTKKGVGSAESTLVLKGEKSPSAVVCLKIKDYEHLGENAKKILLEIVGEVKGRKGLIDWKEEHIFIVFSPLVTKTFDNELLASKEGFAIAKKIEESNKKFSDKIRFNVGIHSGELIASKQDGKLKYTSIGNTISLAKRIADSDEDKVLVSESIRKKMRRDLSVVKDKEIGKNQLYAVSGIKNREANEAKLKDLLKRMDKK
jgi:hypothetical protein